MTMNVCDEFMREKGYGRQDVRQKLSICAALEKASQERGGDICWKDFWKGMLRVGEKICKMNKH